MKNDKNLKHVQVPNEMQKHNLNLYDHLVYASIKRFQTKTIKNPKVSVKDIRTVSKLPREQIIKSIYNLQNEGYITVINEGRGHINQFKFDEYKKFEPFSYDFLDNEDLTAKQKAYMIVLQQKMFKTVQGKGKTTLTNEEIAKETGLSSYEVKKLNQALKEKGYLSILSSKEIDPTSGLKKDIKVFDLEKSHQMIIWFLQQHEAKINLHEEQITEQREHILQQGEDLQEIATRITNLENKVEDKNKLIDQILQDNKQKDKKIQELTMKLQKAQTQNIKF